LVKAPIRYGRLSRSKTYTMVFDPGCRDGQAKVRSCLRSVSSIADLVEEAKALWVAETSPQHRLVGGTAFHFCREDQRGAYDYLFVDEAGQVSLGKLVAMACAAANIVLVGDQMQLPQPVQGVHPGETGLSSLEYLVEDKATVPEDRGILLNETRRLHPPSQRRSKQRDPDGSERSGRTRQLVRPAAIGTSFRNSGHGSSDLPTPRSPPPATDAAATVLFYGSSRNRVGEFRV
jgi:hypothetical protein